jgi:hypothetical protein
MQEQAPLPFLDFSNNQYFQFKSTEYHSSKNSLENSILSVTTEEPINTLAKVFSNKSITSKASVKALLEEIDQRKNLHSKLLK